MPIDFGGLAAGGLAAGLGALGGSDNRDSYRNARSRGRRIIQRSIFPAISAGFGAQRADLQDALAAIREGYDQARSEVGNLGNVARNRVLEREQVLQGNLAQSLTDRGLSGTTAGDAGSRGIAYDTNQQLQSIDEELGRLYSDLAIGRGQSLASGYGALAGVRGAQTQAELQAYNDLLALFTQLPIGNPQVDLGGLAGPLNSVFGALGSLGSKGPTPPPGFGDPSQMPFVTF